MIKTPRDSTFASESPKAEKHTKGESLKILKFRAQIRCHDFYGHLLARIADDQHCLSAEPNKLSGYEYQVSM